MAVDFKNEEEVKEYLENIGIEYRFGCFSEKNPSSCHLLADYLEAVKKDYDKAAKVYKNNCDDSSFGKSCYKYGNALFLGRGVKKNLKASLNYYEKGCTGGEANSCLYGGLMYVSNSKASDEIPKDYKIGMELLQKGCDKDNPTSCHYLAGMFISGVKNYLEKDMAKAFQFSLKACDLGNMYACANVSRMYKQGDGVKEDLSKYEEFKKKALEMQSLLTEAPKHIPFQQGT
ncbi:UNVERIFIED_CONTAM: hypothetical protein RMT77_009779 [Armadillidium vulgare]